MNITEALQNLKLQEEYNIHNIHDLSIQELKKTYHIMALNLHPDKNINNTSYTKESFIIVQESYQFLYKLIKSEKLDENNSGNNATYSDLILSFINLLLSQYTTPNGSNISNNERVKIFQSGCIQYSCTLIEQMLDKLDINILEDIYNLIVNNKFTGFQNCPESNFSHRTLDMLKNCILNKLKKYNIYILNPTIKNLLNNDVYKLEISNNVVGIPLWHHDMEFEDNIIKIEPNIESNIEIDRDNNIKYYYETTYHNIVNLITQNKYNIEISMGQITYNIPINRLTFNARQTYIFNNCGIPKINLTDIYDISIKRDIVFDITIRL